MLEKRTKCRRLGKADFSERGQDGFCEVGRGMAKGHKGFQRAGSEGESPSSSSASFIRVWYHPSGLRGWVSQAFARILLLPVESRLPFKF